MNKNKINTVIWLVSISFVLFQFLIQMSSGLIIHKIMHEISLSAFQGGIIGAAFYLAYTPMQIPVGILFDYKNTRFLLTMSAFICAIGCLLFSLSVSPTNIFISRFIMGLGASFAFVGLSVLLRALYPIKEFAYRIGLSEMLGFTGIIFGIFTLGMLIHLYGWRPFSLIACFVGLSIASACYIFIPKKLKPKAKKITKSDIISVITSPILWINGTILGLSFMTVSVFGGMWALPYLSQHLGFNLPTAGFLNALFFLGVAISCPVYGKLALETKQLIKLIIASNILTLVFFLLLIQLEPHNIIALSLLLLLIGLSCGGYMLTFTLSNKYAPKNALSTATGFTNTLGMCTAPIFQPLMGLLLDNFGHYVALLTLPTALMISTLLCLKLMNLTFDINMPCFKDPKVSANKFA